MSSPNELAGTALALTGRAAELLRCWLDGFAEQAAAGEPVDLKELGAHLTCVKRTLEIARIAGALDPGEGGGDGWNMDPEALRRILSDED